jgi:ferredoxin
MSTVTLTIDDTEIEAQEGMTVLEAARSAGIYIPALCSHPDLPPSRGMNAATRIYRGGELIEGSDSGREFEGCGLCIVEIEGMEGLPTSCTAPVAEGMVVHTNTPEVQEQRRERLSHILATHPHYCLTCPYHEGCHPAMCSVGIPDTDRCCPLLNHCELQAVAEYIGVKEDTPPYNFRGLPTTKEEPLFNRDYNLCISCLRCVKICREVRGVGALDFTYHDGEVVVGFTAPSPEESGCKFCGACVEVCPTGALLDKEFKLAERELSLVPCKYTCPAGVDVPRYVRLIAEGKFAEALAVIREKVPFPTVLGRVCFHPCEAECRHGELGDPIAIRALKRFAADRDDGLWKQNLKVTPATGKRVAIAGSGPAGLTAAYFLAKKGHSVTVFEALPQAGGMMRVGIPEQQLPREIVDREIGAITELGVEIKTNAKVESVDELLQQGYNAIFLALGSHFGKWSKRFMEMPEFPSQLGIALSEGNKIEVDAETLATNREGVFAGGEVVARRPSVIEAIAAGRRAASSIDKYLGGNGVIDEPLIETEEAEPYLGREEGFATKGRVAMPTQDKVELGYSEEQAVAEAKRCLRCDLRLKISPVVLPPAPWLELATENISSLPESEGMFQLLDAEKKVLYIKGTMNLRQELEELMEAEEPSLESARYFLYEENYMYTMRESELIQKYLQEHGSLPPGNAEII